MSECNVGFIGCGNIASAIIGGAISSGYIKPNNIHIFDISAEKVESLSRYGVFASSSAVSVILECDFVFLTVKPQSYPDLIAEIKSYISPKTCIIDVAAGMTIERVKNLFECDLKVIRVMPNTPILYSGGATAMVFESPVSKDEFDFVKGIFDACGVTAVVAEDGMDTVTGISGSSPAFFFRFAREIINAGVKMGLSEESAKQLVVQTMLGSAIMLGKSDKSADELIRAVASPNGTTEAGLKKMDEIGFDGEVEKIIEAAVNRSKELSK